jgi:hypothetical protein
MNENIKRHIISAGLSFLVGFALVVIPMLQDLTLQTLEGGALLGIIFAGARGGLKVVLEAFVAWYQNRKV